MRLIIATAAAALAISMMAPTPGFSEPKKKASAPSVNQCIQLARQRGFTDSDLDSSGGAGTNRARNFVIRCMQGRQR